jgi:hypothetical protein
MTDRKNTLTWYSDGKQQMKISAWHLTWLKDQVTVD